MSDSLGRAGTHLRRYTILRGLKWSGWHTPMELGGYDSSHHSSDLLYLTRRGFAEKKRRYVGVSGGSNMYRITSEGETYLKEHP